MFPWEESYQQPEQPVDSLQYRTSPTTGQPIPHITIGGTPSAPTQMGAGEDIARSIGRGIMEGFIGLADIPHLLELGADKLNEYLSSKGLVERVDAPKDFPEPYSPKIQSAVETVTGPFHEPQTEYGVSARNIASFAPGMLIGGPAGGAARGLAGRALTRAAGGALVPGAGSEAAGRVAQTYAPKYEGVFRLGGALLAPRLATPTRAQAPERAALVRTLEQEGIPLTAGQRTGSKPIQWAEASAADLPLAAGRAAERNEATARAFTGAAMGRMGAPGQMATPEVLARETARIGNTFETLSARNAIRPDPRLYNDIATARRQYESVVGANRRAPIINDTIRDINDAIRQGGGRIDGAWYSSTRSSIDRTARGLRQSDPQLSEALFGLRNALDNAMGRSISRADRAAWQEARRQWANWKIIERTVTGGGAEGAQGFLSPAQLRAAAAAPNRGAYARGRGEMTDLARAGAGVLKPLPQSGTAPRAFMMGAGTVGAGGLGYSQGDVAGGLAGIATPILLSRGLMSRPAQAWLGNRALPSTRDERLLQMLMGLYTTQAPATAR